MEELSPGMKKQVRSFKMLEEYCTDQYRKKVNPLVEIRALLKDIGIKNTSVTYMETAEPINIGQVVDWASGKKRPMLVIHALKVKGFTMAVSAFMLESTKASRPAKNYAIKTKPVCSHCGHTCVPVDMDEDMYMGIDQHGVESVPEVVQYLYEGGTLCEDCYAKEGGII